MEALRGLDESRGRNAAVASYDQAISTNGLALAEGGVYSVNAVGYVNVTTPKDFSFSSNALDSGASSSITVNRMNGALGNVSVTAAGNPADVDFYNSVTPSVQSDDLAWGSTNGPVPDRHGFHVWRGNRCDCGRGSAERGEHVRWGTLSTTARSRLAVVWLPGMEMERRRSIERRYKGMRLLILILIRGM